MALKRAVARKQLEILNEGYSHHGASRKKKSLRGWISSGGSSKEDIDDNLELLRERSRDLYMGAPFATGAIKTTRTNVIGSGLRLKSQIDYEYLNLDYEEAATWEANVEREFNLWAESVNCDSQRMNDFYELQQLAFLSWLMSGECFALLPFIPRPNMPYDIRVMLIEADRVCTPVPEPKSVNKIINGVEVDKNGAVLAYHIAQRHPGSRDFKEKQKWNRVEKFGAKTGRYNVIHLMESERPEQRRGVPMLAPVIECLKQLSRYTEAELMAAVISGMFTVFIESQNESSDGMLGEMIDEEDQVSDSEYNYELGNGAIVGLAPGEKANIANPGRPNTAFDGFVTSICRQIGAAIEVPYELLIKHFSASYSASRASLLEAWKMFRMRRSWMANDFCKPIYEEWLCEAVASGRVSAPGFFNDPMIRKAYCGAEWNGPSQGQIDPLKEVNAAEKRVANGFSTRARETQELTGGDWQKNYRQRVREEKLMREGGLISDGQVLDIQEPRDTEGGTNAIWPD
ncbi:phage portal protein [Clostridium cylindrosporum]|uniref:Phage portal protein, lambda family n=1 Tax=Clostridium cylindrosporum DSM 605 TaxID=1121307 RepID=A0A0J8DFK0_CLOCY|nr:phage portal protein [Clostridium cylindrosporum]KMT22999.1 phage portal protein, lambda family [Clostridium cylindrosporum DSM 605]